MFLFVQFLFCEGTLFFSFNVFQFSEGKYVTKCIGSGLLLSIFVRVKNGSVVPSYSLCKRCKVNISG